MFWAILLSILKLSLKISHYRNAKRLHVGAIVFHLNYYCAQTFAVNPYNNCFSVPSLHGCALEKCTKQPR